MISRDQIHRLESKVQKAVEYIDRLKKENERLRGSLAAYETRIDELELRIDEIRADQSEIERGVLSALDQLERVDEQADDDTEAVVSAETSGDEPGDTDPGRLVRTVDAGENRDTGDAADSPSRAVEEPSASTESAATTGSDDNTTVEQEESKKASAENTPDNEEEAGGDDQGDQENELDIF